MTKHTSASATFTRDWLDSQAELLRVHADAFPPYRDPTQVALDSMQTHARAQPIRGERLARSAGYLLIASILCMGVATVAIWTHILLDSMR